MLKYVVIAKSDIPYFKWKDPVQEFSNKKDALKVIKEMESDVHTSAHTLGHGIEIGLYIKVVK